MDHIFGNSDDIAFGSTPPKPRPPERQPLSHTSRPPQDRVRKPVSQTSARRPERSHGGQYEPPTLGDTPALSRLISGMKPSFLPPEEDASALRCVVLSEVGAHDPLMMFRADATTILFGTGFGNITKAGKEYPTFPDMRLIFSEKDRLFAWIIADESVSVEYFQYILPTLGFPPIYASRDIIAKFRNNIHDTSFLDKCRFFELFTPGVTDRRIGDLEVSLTGETSAPILTLRASHTLVGIVLTDGVGATPKDFTLLQKKDDILFLEQEKVTPGEILIFRGKTIAKHTLKYTFDTFYVDNSSIGVVAGYTLSDREMLADNGVLMFTLEEDMRARTIAGHIFIDSRGFVHAHEMMAVHKEILKGIRATYENLITANEKIERGELVQSLRREITKYCFLLTGRTPVVMPIVIER